MQVDTKKIKDSFSEKKILIKNLFLMFSLKGVDLIIPLILTPYLVRVVGIEKFGLISFSIAYASFFSVFVKYGFDITASRDIAKIRDNKSHVSYLYSQHQFCILILSVLTFCVSAFVVFLVPDFRDDKLLFLSAIGLTIIQAAFPAWIFLGLEKMGFIAVLSSVSKVIYLVLLFFIVTDESDYIYANLIYMFASFASLFSAILVVRFYLGIRFEKVSIVCVIRVLRRGLGVFIMQVSPVFYNNGSTFLLGVTASPSAVGIYAAAQKVVEVCVAVGGLMAKVFLPYIAVDLSRHGFFSKVMVATGVLFTSLMVLLSDFLSKVLYGEAGSEVSSYLMVMSFGVFFSFVYLVYGVNYLPITGNDKIAAKISFVVSFLALLVAMFLIPFIGLIGAVLVIVFSRAGLAGWSFYAYRRTVS